VFLSTILTAAGDILIRSSGGITRLAGASSAAQLSYTTADGAIGPVWTVLDTGGLVHSGATTLGAGSSEQILHISGGVPAWKDSSIFLSTIMTAAGDILIRSSAGIVRLAGASSAGYLKYSTVDGAIGPSWAILDPGEIPVQTTAAGGTTSIQVPSSGAVLAYSTADGAVGPDWIVMDPGELITQTSAAVTTVVAIPSSGAILTFSTVDGSIGPAWLDVSTGELVTRSSDGTMKSLAIPSSDAILQFSTVDGSIGPAWLKPGDGQILISDADGDLEWLAIGTSGQVLQSTAGIPSWQDEAAASTLGWTNGARVSNSADISAVSGSQFALTFDTER
ncbi:hypothetical protein LCGC14_3164700, partial [marine sediment metagenome]